ncbi:hypothetical protein E2C01_028162 [Portunus trituberculatus]|uniref:Uncharacterized protein n=1 Tax=Portunus trituberculatus TaxID=210409 RepID=A0A5B7EJX7_PORTR|nr:hypothetical protein [Portunus trituberculatus]
MYFRRVMVSSEDVDAVGKRFGSLYIPPRVHGLILGLPLRRQANTEVIARLSNASTSTSTSYVIVRGIYVIIRLGSDVVRPSFYVSFLH